MGRLGVVLKASPSPKRPWAILRRLGGLPTQEGALSLCASVSVSALLDLSIYPCICIFLLNIYISTIVVRLGTAVPSHVNFRCVNASFSNGLVRGSEGSSV